MRDLIFSLLLLGVLVGVGCGTVRAQYRAESPNYQLEYLDENAPSNPGVRGEVQFDQRESEPQATALPATNPPYVLIGAAIAAVVIAIVAYIALK